MHGFPRATKDIDLLVHPHDLPEIELQVKKAGCDVLGGILTFKQGTAEETRLVRFSKFSDSGHLTLDLPLVTPVFEPVGFHARRHPSMRWSSKWCPRAGLPS